MRKYYHVVNRPHERIELRISNHQRRTNLQHHEVVSANLRQKSGIAKQAASPRSARTWRDAPPQILDTELADVVAAEVEIQFPSTTPLRRTSLTTAKSPSASASRACEYLPASIEPWPSSSFSKTSR